MVGIGRWPNPLVVWEGLVLDSYTIQNKLNVFNKESKMKGIALLEVKDFDINVLGYRPLFDNP